MIFLQAHIPDVVVGFDPPMLADGRTDLFIIAHLIRDVITFFPTAFPGLQFLSRTRHFHPGPHLAGLPARRFLDLQQIVKFIAPLLASAVPFLDLLPPLQGGRGLTEGDELGL